MGGQLVRAAIRRGHALSATPYKCLVHMAVSIMPDTLDEPIYYGGRDALVRAVYGELAPKGARRENQYREISRALAKLYADGLIDPISDGHKGQRAEYRLILTAPAKGGETPHAVKGGETPHALDASEGPKGGETPPPKGGEIAPAKHGETPHPKEATTGSKKQEASEHVTSVDGGSSRDSAEPSAFGSSIQSSNHLANPSPLPRAKGHEKKIEIDHEKPKAALDTSSVKRRGSNAGEPPTLDDWKDDPEHCANCGLHYLEHTEEHMRQLGMDFHNFWPNARMSAAQYRLLIDRLEGERIRRLAELAEQERQQEAERQEREKLAEEIRWPRLTGPVCVKCGFVKQTCRTFDRDSTHQYTPPPLCVVCLFPEKDCRKFDRDRTHEFIPPVGGVRHLGRIEVAQDGRQVVVWDDGSRGPILDRCPDCNQHIDTEGHPDSCPLGRGITFFPLVPLHALESRHIVRHGRSTPSTDRK